MLHWMQWKMLE
jgi:Acetyl-CoA acetyltransferase